jgi:hypothetical protein
MRIVRSILTGKIVGEWFVKLSTALVSVAIVYGLVQIVRHDWYSPCLTEDTAPAYMTDDELRCDGQRLAAELDDRLDTYTRYHDLVVMLELCRSDVEREEAGFCAGYITALWIKGRHSSEFCIPFDVTYEEMVRVVIDQLRSRLKQLTQKNADRSDADKQIETALRVAWPCKK